MARLKNSDWHVPFWGKKGYSTGRDPLGMQVASIGTYAILLPGLTNLTRRVRYYSFYCWIVERYAHDESHTDYDVFRRFIRRAELQFAYGMALCFPESPAVVGSDWAKRALKEAGENIPGEHEIDLAAGADQSGGRTYWKYSLGAFGQYFLGSLLQLGLLREREGSPGVYLCTDSGRHLAEKFADRIEVGRSDAFFAAVKTGKTNAESLRLIIPSISLDELTPNTEEWNFLVELLNGPDDGGRSESPTFFRKSTIESYLSFLSGAPKDEITFSRQNYTDVLSGGVTSASVIQRGWFVYELNEIAHYSFGTVLWGLLEILYEKSHPVPYRDLEHELTQGIIAALREISKGVLSARSVTADIGAFVKSSSLSEDQIEASIEEAIDGGAPYPAMAYGILLAVKLFLRINADTDVLAAFVQEHGMARELDFSDMIAFLRVQQPAPLAEMISMLLRRNIVNRHIEESVRKMGGGVRNTLKFRNEDGRLFHIQTVVPQWTQPRLGSLDQFLTDLKMLDAEGSVTPNGARIIQGSP